MSLIKERPWYSEVNEQRLVSGCFFAIAIIAAINAVLRIDIGFALLYLLPLTIAAAFFSRWQILAVSLICTLFAEGLSHSELEIERIPRAIVIFVSYLFIGLTLRDMVAYRRAATRRLHELEDELLRLHKADAQLQLVMNSAPVGVLTLSSEGRILTCNRAAHEILAVGPGGLIGKSIDTFLSSAPDNDQSQSQQLGYTLMRADGDQSQVQVWTTSIVADEQVLKMIVILPL